VFLGFDGGFGAVERLDCGWWMVVTRADFRW
jgi:hypothetical protein